MNHHYKKLGFKIPDNYFKESKKKTLVLITKNNPQVNKNYSFSFYQLSIAAIIICTLVYYTFSSSNEIETNFNIKSAIKFNSFFNIVILLLLLMLCKYRIVLVF